MSLTLLRGCLGLARLGGMSGSRLREGLRLVLRSPTPSSERKETESFLLALLLLGSSGDFLFAISAFLGCWT